MGRMAMFNVESAARIGNSLMPLLIIFGLLVLWMMIVIVCMNFNQAIGAFFGNMMVR